MNTFEPRPFQKEVFEKIASGKFQSPLYWGRPRHTVVGVDMANPPSTDKSVVTLAKRSRSGRTTIIAFDEYSNWLSYRWYRNPIKWWQWKRIEMTIKRQARRSSHD